jgi:hypothetical protein
MESGDTQSYILVESGREDIPKGSDDLELGDTLPCVRVESVSEVVSTGSDEMETGDETVRRHTDIRQGSDGDPKTCAGLTTKGDRKNNI